MPPFPFYAPERVVINAAPPSPDWLATQLAAFFSHAVTHGYSVKPTTLSRRSTRHFTGASGIVRNVAHDLQIRYEAGDDWTKWSTAALTDFIVKSNAFVPLVDGYAVVTGEVESPEYETEPDAEKMALLAENPEALAAWLERDEADDVPLYAPFVATRPLPEVTPSISPMLPVLNDVSDITRMLDVSREEWDDALTRSRYRLRGVRKSSGGVRLIEIPSEALRVLQRRALHRLLDHLPVHDAAHGFVRGRSVHTHAAAHVGRDIVIRLDLKDFFPSIGGARAFLLFRSLGYNVRVANALTALCVAQQTRRSLRDGLKTLATTTDINALLPRFGVTHLPQGAPTSPALANLCARSLDVRLDAWAKSFGARYTRYADDLVFSGDAALAKSWRAFIATARVIIAEEGWKLNVQKTRVMRRSVRQAFTGLVVNSRVNVARDEFDALKASVHRFCKPDATANADELRVLLGRVAWLGQSHPARAEKLRAKLFAANSTRGDA